MSDPAPQTPTAPSAAFRFRQWLRLADSGDRFIYHLGHLAEDRVHVDGAPVELVESVATAAWEAQEAGLVELTQVRVEARFAYRATRTSELAG